MTTEVSSSELSLSKADLYKRISKDLVIKSVDTTPAFMKKKQTYKPQSSIQLFEHDNNGNFIVPFHYYQELMSEHGKNVYPNDNETYEGDVFNFTGSLLPRQEHIKDEIIQTLDLQRCLILSLYCGFGKTIMAIYLAQHLISKLDQGKVGVCCHRLVLIDQWVYSIKKMTDAKVQIVTAKNKIDPDANFYVFNLQNIPKRDLQDLKDIAVFIIDECHTICTQNLAYAMMFLRPKYCIGLSATPERADGIDEVLYKYMSKTIIERKMRRNYMVYIYESVFNIPARDMKKNEKTDTIDWNFCLEMQSENEQRNNQICDIVKTFPKRNILILCKRVSHVQTLYDKLNDTEDVEMFTGSKKTFNVTSRILIVTCSKGGVGFDHPKLDMLIIAADVENLFIQYLGRVFRRDDSIPIVVDIKDKFQPFVRHLKTRLDIYNNTGGIINKYDELFKK